MLHSVASQASAPPTGWAMRTLPSPLVFVSSCFLLQPLNHHRSVTEHASPAPVGWCGPTIKAQWLYKELVSFSQAQKLIQLMFPFQKSTWCSCDSFSNSSSEDPASVADFLCWNIFWQHASVLLVPGCPPGSRLYVWTLQSWASSCPVQSRMVSILFACTFKWCSYRYKCLE